MMACSVHPSWSESFPGARMGFLEARGLPPLASHPALDAACRSLEAELRAAYGGWDRKQLRSLPVMHAFDTHFRTFGKTYHVLLQLESVASKGRPIPTRLCAVTALFLAELRHGLVAAGHDLARIAPGLSLRTSRGGEQYLGVGDATITLPAGDMILQGPDGIRSSVLYGPEAASPIGPATTEVLYTVYAPASAPAEVLELQLRDMEQALRLYAPEAAIRAWILP